MSVKKRSYRMRQRADGQAATRLRITESAVELHQTLGPSQTTMAAVAERAGVQRSTLYRHFADETALFAACSAHWYARHPPPDVRRWRDIPDPGERLVAALTELYAWYRGTGTMLDALIRDEQLVPAVGQRFVAFHERLDRAHDLLLAGRGIRGTRRANVSALIGLALKFESWRSLCRESGLEDRPAAELMATLVAAASRGEGPRHAGGTAAANPARRRVTPRDRGVKR
jgi:AcrR family transcriptional regulator